MSGTVRALWRHPIKSHGREAMDQLALIAGSTIPWDRRWAVAHEAARTDGTSWAQCANFSIGAKIPALTAINATCDEAAGTVTLSHPQRPDLTFDPDRDPQALLDWVRPLMPEDRAQSTRIIRVDGRGMTDTDYPSVSLLNLESNADLSTRMGTDLSPLRWRCNIHFDGMAPWSELDLIGRDVAVGGAVLRVREPIIRCKTTTANPATGLRDADTLAALRDNRGHQNFGIYAEVIQSGDVAPGDRVTPL